LSADSIGPPGAGSGRGDPETESAATPESGRPLSRQTQGSGRAPGQADQPAAAQADENSGKVAPGSLVLATLGAGEGWWESLVVEMKEDLLTLKWRDWPKEPSFVRRTSQIARLHPSRN